MPTISVFRGIRVFVNFEDHRPPHFHAEYGGEEVVVAINEVEVLAGGLPAKQLKMLLGWAAFHQDELRDNWELAARGEAPFAIAPLQ